jgi:hypothetical protein
MAPVWEASSFEHFISQRQQVWVMLHPTYQRIFEAGNARTGDVLLITGYSHELNEDEIEILVRVWPDGRTSHVFHCNYLSEKIRRYREEYPDGWTPEA